MFKVKYTKIGKMAYVYIEEQFSFLSLGMKAKFSQFKNESK